VNGYCASRIRSDTVCQKNVERDTSKPYDCFRNKPTRMSPPGFSKVSGLVGPAGVLSQEMLRVKIYRVQVKPEVIGELRFDGKRVTTAQAKDERDKKLLKHLLRRPAILRRGLVNDVYAKDNPALFLRLLCQTYRSHFFWASEAEAALT